MTDYPYEGDLWAVVEAVTVPRLVHEAAAFALEALGIPPLPKDEIDAVLAPLDVTLAWKRFTA